MSGGWIKLHRSVRDHPALKGMLQRFLWEELLLRAAHQGIKVNWRGETVGLLPGQIALSIRAICDEFDLPRKAVRLAIDRFEREDMVKVASVCSTKKGPGKGPIGTMLTICNWEKYQLYQESRGPIEGPIGAQLGPIEQEGKNLKEERILKDAAPNGDALEFDFDRDLYLMAEQLFGPKGRGLATTAKKKLGDLGKAVNLFQAARTKAEPREYIMKSLSNATKRREDLCKA